VTGRVSLMGTIKATTAIAFMLATALLSIPISSAFALDTKLADAKQVDTQLAKMLDEISKAQASDEYEKLESRNRALSINDGALKKHQFFQAGKKLLDSISFAFGPYGDGTEFEITKDKKILKVPVIKAPGKDEPGSGTPTGKFLNYYFDGSKFVFRKN